MSAPDALTFLARALRQLADCACMAVGAPIAPGMAGGALTPATALKPRATADDGPPEIHALTGCVMTTTSFDAGGRAWGEAPE